MASIRRRSAAVFACAEVVRDMRLRIQVFPILTEKIRSDRQQGQHAVPTIREDTVVLTMTEASHDCHPTYPVVDACDMLYRCLPLSCRGKYTRGTAPAHCFVQR
jgi:hypothetical protein